MKTQKKLIKLLVPVWLVASTQLGKAEDPPDMLEQVSGDWIIYRGDQYEIKRISSGKVHSSFYDWKGNLRNERTSDLKLNSSTGGESKTIIEQGSEWHYLAGGKTPEDSSWTGLSFAAKKAGWKTGKAGFGYGDDDDETVLDDMESKYLSVFIRREFELPEKAELKGLGLLINYDDAFVLHANGRRLFHSSNLTVDEKTGEVTVGNHEANGAEFFSLSEYASAFRTGKNVIAIQGINTKLDSTDFTLDPQVMMGGTGSFVETNRKERHESFLTDHFFKDRVWDGKIDNLQIWGRAFNADEVVALWNKGKGTAQVPENLADGLIGHWPFDGDFKDSSGNDRHGTGKNSPGFAKGQFGQALDLNGENQYVTLGGKAADYTPAGGSITVSLWFSVDEFDKRWQTLVALGDAGWSDWRIHRFGLSDNMGFVGGRWARNNASILDGKMHHIVAITEKGKGARLFLDNTLASNNAPNNQASSFAGILPDEDGWLPAVGANLQRHIGLSKPLEGEFIPMQDSLRIVATSLTQGGGNNNSFSGVYRKVDHPEEALLLAARSGDKKKVAELLKAGVSPDTASRNSYGALGYAGIGGHLEIMKLLIAHKADVNRRARFMKTPLNVTAGSSHIASAKLLLANGAEVGLANGNGAFVTHESAFWGQPEMLEFLLTEAKVDPNLRSKNGQTALHYAMWKMVRGNDEFNKPYLKCIQLLLKHGTNPDLRGGNNNRTPLEMALNNGFSDVVALLKAQ
ncbi:MAG: ankyrin repeat domain-containing protein [Roseibacillus sp.]|nr:ankyrin repeat domain-containing protein [Roseibacillus sp.]